MYVMKIKVAALQRRVDNDQRNIWGNGYAK